MTQVATRNAYAVLAEPATLIIERVLPGPVERVWSYLTESDLRRQWLASGEMQMETDTPFELVWRNNELTKDPGNRPAGFDGEHRMQSRIVEADPPRKLVFTWGESGEVAITLDAQGSDVLLTLTHRRLPDDAKSGLNIQAGWHAHLDVLVSRLTGAEPEPFWDSWTSLREEYAQRTAA